MSFAFKLFFSCFSGFSYVLTEFKTTKNDTAAILVLLMSVNFDIVYFCDFILKIGKLML